MVLLPCDNSQFQYLIDRELLIVRNIPKSLSSDTIYKYLSHYGPVLDSQMMKESSSRNQCLVLMKSIQDAIDMQNTKIASIGGFYLEKVTWENHAYLLDRAFFEKSVSPVRKSKTPSPIFAKAAEPSLQKLYYDYTDNGAEFNQEKIKGQKPQRSASNGAGDNDLDFDFQSTQELGKQLIQGYAQVIATSYLAFSTVADQFGIRGLVIFFLSLFRVIAIYKVLFAYFRVESRISKLIAWGDETKIAIASTPAGRPIIDQLDLVIDTASDLVLTTQKIISQERKRIKRS